jgi:NADH-quinone oxidoreductase subunit H
VLVGSFRLGDLVEAQRGLWFIFYPGIGQIAFLVFFIAAMGESNKAPLDLVEAESELVAAYNVEYSGMKFALFFAGEYAHTLAIAALAATVFLGGYLGPGPVWLGPAWLVLKSLALFLLVLWVRWSFLRLRIDQALRLNWVYLFPAALVNLMVAAWWALGR